MIRALLLFLTLLFVASPAWAAPAFDAFTVFNGVSSATHTPAGTPRFVGVICVDRTSPPADNLSTVTYGSLTLTEASGSPLLHDVTDTNEEGAVHFFWAGSGIPTGAQTVTTHAFCESSWVMTLTAAANTELADVDTFNTDSVTNPSLTLSAGGVSVYAFVGFMSGVADPLNITPSTNWTARAEWDDGPQTHGFYTFDTVGSSDVTCGWTQTAEDATAFCVAVREVAAAGCSARLTLLGVGC